MTDAMVEVVTAGVRPEQLATDDDIDFFLLKANGVDATPQQTPQMHDAFRVMVTHALPRRSLRWRIAVMLCVEAGGAPVDRADLDAAYEARGLWLHTTPPAIPAALRGRTAEFLAYMGYSGPIDLETMYAFVPVVLRAGRPSSERWRAVLDIVGKAGQMPVAERELDAVVDLIRARNRKRVADANRTRQRFLARDDFGDLRDAAVACVQRTRAEGGHGPTWNELADALGLTRAQTWHLIKALTQTGHLTHTRQTRSLDTPPTAPATEAIRAEDCPVGIQQPVEEHKTA